MLGPEGDAEFLEHVSGHRIRAQADQHIAFGQGDDIRDAHRVVEVRLGVMNHGGAGFGQEIHLPPVHVNAVRGNTAGAQDAEFIQPFDHAHPVLLLGVLLVAQGFGDMNVEAGAQLVTKSRGLLKGGILESEGGVEAEKGGCGGLRVEG